MSWYSQGLLRLIIGDIHRSGFLLDCQSKVISAYLKYMQIMLALNELYILKKKIRLK